MKDSIEVPPAIKEPAGTEFLPPVIPDDRLLPLSMTNLAMGAAGVIRTASAQGLHSARREMNRRIAAQNSDRSTAAATDESETRLGFVAKSRDVFAALLNGVVEATSKSTRHIR